MFFVSTKLVALLQSSSIIILGWVDRVYSYQVRHSWFGGPSNQTLHVSLPKGRLGIWLPICSGRKWPLGVVDSRCGRSRTYTKSICHCDSVIISWRLLCSDIKQ